MPFTFENSNAKGFGTVVLNDTHGNCRAEVVPSCGAILHSFGIRSEGAFLDVIDHYEDAEDFKKNCTQKGFRGCKLSPFVCRLKGGRYRYGEQDRSIAKFYLGGHALHGLLYDADFSIQSLAAEDTGASVVLKHEYRGEDPGYPFCYDCVVTYTLGSGNHLTVVSTVTNHDALLIPVADGWHPYFTLGGKIDELLLQFQCTGILEFDPELIPTGKLLPYTGYVSLKKIGNTVFDNCFVLNASAPQPLCVIRNLLRKIQVEIRPERSYPYLQLYTPPHRESIAIENLSAAPDAFNNGMGLINLEPGASATFKTAYTISCLP